MQTIITGAPGSGKTLHAIEKLLLRVIGTTVKGRDADDQPVEYPRTIYTNINGLLLEHELVEAGPPWDGNEKAGWKQAEGNRKGWHNWHEWAPPGAVLVVDEFQKVWPPRPNGAPVPPDVQAMDTHRHKGVDFILISQNANNFDRHISGLAGRHLHVRRVANLPMAIVYEWDHVSRSLLYRNAFSKTPWWYKTRVYKLYKSAEVHTSQPRKLPALLFVLIGAIGLAAWKIPESAARILARSGTPIQSAQPAANAPGRIPPPSYDTPAPAQKEAPVPGSVAAGGIPQAPASAAVVAAGCVTMRGRCRCFDVDGKPAPALPEICEPEISPPGLALDPAAAGGRPAFSDAAVDGAALARMGGRAALRALTE